MPYGDLIRDMAKSFVIPADNDDSSVNLALLGLLNETKSPHFDFWNSLNLKKQEFYTRALKYAYRPFSNSKNHSDEIDPRTYFILRKFLQNIKTKDENASLILPTTWMIDSSE